jgi:signal transduction histidine kinase/ActR/RegA family two-component response regulator
MFLDDAKQLAKPESHGPDLTLEMQVEARTAELRKALATVEQQKHALETALRMRDETQRQLESDLEDARLLQSTSSMLVDEDQTGDLYQRLVEAAALVMRSDFATIQRYDQERGELELIAHNGLNDEALAFWRWVRPGQATTCGRALAVGERVVVPDFETCDFIAGSDDLIAFRKAGVKAAQSTPLLTRGGRLVGMITTHWTRNHAPHERNMHLLDIIARQAADLIERNISAQAVRQQAARLVDADRYKNEFLATLAHELRNPLAPIRTGVSLLKIGKQEQVPRIAAMMERQLGHMVRLIDDLLDVSRISRGMVTLKRSKVELGTVIDSAIETSRPLINAFNHKFTVTVPGNVVWLEADVTRVAQIVSNLLNNAAKYTPAGGQIELVAETAGNEVVIRVIDTGIGIPPAMLPKIFDLFTQVDRTTERSQSGLGVGLALAKRLAEMHEGAIEVESRQGQPGSIFSLRLPMDAAAAPDAADGHAREHGAGPASAVRIMIVDDNADAAETLALLLGELGHATSVVLDSRLAVAEALAFKPDVVFLDIGMPYLNGLDLAALLREQPALEHCCLAVLSGWGTEDDRTKTRRVGIDYHLTKPVVLSEVTDMLAKRRHGVLSP